MHLYVAVLNWNGRKNTKPRAPRINGAVEKR
jgi:hypothetical protein